MVPITGTKVPKMAGLPCRAEFARAIGTALRSELGSSRRATKSVMGWAGVSDRTARKWLQGSGCPDGHNLVALCRNCRAVMTVVLKLTGYGYVGVLVELRNVEATLVGALQAIRELLDE